MMDMNQRGLIHTTAGWHKDLGGVLSFYTAGPVLPPQLFTVIYPPGDVREAKQLCWTGRTTLRGRKPEGGGGLSSRTYIRGSSSHFLFPSFLG